MMDNEEASGSLGTDRLSGGRSRRDRPVSRLTALNATLTLHPVWMWGLKPGFIGLLAVLAASPVLIVSPLVADAFNVDISKTAIVVVACLVWMSATAAYLFARRSGVLDERDRLPRRKTHPKIKASLVGTMLGVEDDAAIPTKAHSDRASDAKASPGQTSPRFVVVSQGIDAVNDIETYLERASSLPPPPIPKELCESLTPYGQEYIASIRQALSTYVDSLRGTLIDFDQEYFEIQNVIYDQVIQFLKSAEIEYRTARNAEHEENARLLWKKCELMRLWAHYHEIGSVTEVIDYIENHKEKLQLTTLNYESPVGIGLKK